MVDPQTHATSERDMPAAGKADPAAKASDRAVGSEPRSYRQDHDGHGVPGPSAVRTLASEAAQQGREAIASMREAAFNGAHLWSRSLGPLYAAQMEMMRWLDDLWRETTGGLRPANPSRALSLAPLVGLPPADVKETDQAYTLCVELPGLAKDDIELSVQRDMLVLSGHKSEERDEGGAAYRLSERRFGRFERAFPLPPDVARDRLDAVFKDGVLKIVLPREGELAAQSRARIPIRS